MLTGRVSVANGATPTYSLVNPYTGIRSGSAVALVDSGDQRAIASPTLVAQTGAPQVSVEPVVGVDGRPTTAGLYLVDWDLGQAGYVHAVTPGRKPIYTLAMDTTALGVQGLIGRNLLQTGDFRYQGSIGQYTISLGVYLPPQVGVPARVWAPFLVLFGAGAVVMGALGLE